MPSGKQILSSEIKAFSQASSPSKNLAEASDRLRAGLLLHGSTADSAWPTVERIAWTGDEHLQGPALVSNQLFLADIVTALRAANEIPEEVSERYPDLTVRDYQAGLHVIWLLLSQHYYCSDFSQLENGGELDVEEADKLMKSYLAKLEIYRSNPEEFLGRSLDIVEDEL